MGDQHIYTVGGAVPSNRIYISRQADETLCNLCQTGHFAYILTARQLGKSSLRRRIAQQLDAAGILSIDIDLTAIGTPEDAAAWYMGVLTTIEDILLEKEIILQTDVVTFWKAHTHLGPTQRFTRFFLHVLLAEITSQIVLFVDEIDTTLKMDYTDDFFAAIRYFHEARATYPEFQRLSFVLIGVATPTALVGDPKRTPFNIGQCVHLTDFTYAEALPFASGLGSDAEQARQVLQWVLAWTGGHPYLTQRLCNDLARQTKETFCADDVHQAVRTIFLEEGSHGDDNLKWVGDFLIRGAPEGQVEQVLTTYRSVYRGRAPVYDNPQSAVITHLKLSGLVSIQGNTLCTRNRIYQTVFNEQWIREQWPTGWWASIPPTIKIASAVIAVMFVALLFISGFAVRQQQAMRAERDRANEQVQVARSRQLAALALTNLESEPELGVWLAIQAINTHYTIESENALRAALQSLRTEQAWPFLNAETPMIALALSPDGRRLAAASQNGIVKVWHRAAQSWTSAQTLVNNEAWVGDVAFSPSGEFLAIAGAQTITLWTPTGHLGATLQADGTATGNDPINFYAVAFSPDNAYLAALDLSGKLWIWDTVSANLIVKIAAHEQPGESVAFSPNGHLLVTVGQDDAVKLWDVADIRRPYKVASVNAHAWGAAAVAFSPDGKTLATGGRDTVALLWDIGDDVANPRQRQKLIGHADQISKVAFSPNGKCLATASLDRKVRVWDLDSTLPPLVLSGHRAGITGVVFDSTNQSAPATLLSPCAAQLITASQDGMIRVWNIGASRELLTLAGHNDSVRAIAFSPDGRYIASASDDQSVMIWDVASGQRLHTLLGHGDRVTDVAFSPDGLYVVTASYDKHIKVWAVQSGEELQTLPAFQAGVANVAFSRNGQFLAAADTEGKAHIWSVLSAPLEFRNPVTLKACTQEIPGISFSPDEKRLAITCPTSVLVWDIGSKETEIFHLGNFALRNAAFSPDGKYLGAVGSDDLISLWDLARKEEIIHASGSENRIHRIHFSPNGAWFVTGGDDGVAQLYDVASGQPLQHLPGNVLGVTDVAFSPDNTLVATAGEDDTVRLYVVGIERLLALAQARLIQPPSQAICERYLAPEQCPDGIVVQKKIFH